ncbi:hypothetical protein E2C01_062315 [Portunus trituberculatus]|uniref:Uncharacterized protein n=1 Tax=Portunus trituberculatus TaxID=210409 RepID=A0A5B7H7J3_PORTR|nr:hypothetical protein [Portunus trituberculatus]
MGTACSLPLKSPTREEAPNSSAELKVSPPLNINSGLHYSHILTISRTYFRAHCPHGSIILPAALLWWLPSAVGPKRHTALPALHHQQQWSQLPKIFFPFERLGPQTGTAPKTFPLPSRSPTGNPLLAPKGSGLLPLGPLVLPAGMTGSLWG